MQIYQKIRVIFVITKLELGGAQKQILSLIKGLDNDKFVIFLFTAKEGILVKEALKIDGLNLKLSRFLERPISLAKDLLALIELCFYIRKNHIDIVHTHSSKAGILGRLAARLCKVKVIMHTVHGWSFNDFQPEIKKKFYIFLESLMARFTDALITVSDYDKKKGLDNHIGKISGYRIIHYGINSLEFVGIKHGGIRRELNIDPKGLLIGMVACLKPQKSPQDFLKVAYLVNQSNPNIKFILVGDGILRPSLERSIIKLKLQNNLILVGWRRDIPDILSGIDVFVLTSLWEGLPICVLEAMASGKPVVATDTGGIREVVVDNYTGYLVVPRNIRDMSEKIKQLASDAQMRRTFGENGNKILGNNFRLNDMIIQHQYLYHDLIKGELGTNAN